MRELADLDRALDRLAAGQPGVVQLIGEPGIGKSRLLAELARRPRGEGTSSSSGGRPSLSRIFPSG